MPEASILYIELGLNNRDDPNFKTIHKHIARKFRYPEYAKENNIQGRVSMQFTIDKDGSIENISVLKGMHITLDTE